MHDGASAHFTCNVKQFLDSPYPDQSIGWNGLVLWPPRSFDLNTCWRLPVGPSEGHSLLEKSQHKRQALVYDSNGFKNTMTHDWNFAACQELLVSRGSVMCSN
jgi:hypothetical protein